MFVPNSTLEKRIRHNGGAALSHLTGIQRGRLLGVHIRRGDKGQEGTVHATINRH